MEYIRRMPLPPKPAGIINSHELNLMAYSLDIRMNNILSFQANHIMVSWIDKHKIPVNMMKPLYQFT